MATDNLRIIIEDKVPFAAGLFDHYAQVKVLNNSDITPEAVKDADAMIVRTRTKCNEALLAGSRCKIVATATIGLDHIDVPWCESHGIAVRNSQGCNAPAVAQYVFASLLQISNRPLSQYTIGIVGVGSVGKTIEKWARQLDMRVLLNDPPRQAAEGGEGWSSLDDIARECDIVTFHTTLNPTSYHLADAEFFGKLRRKPIIINAARGPVVDNQALIAALDAGQVHHAVIDTWEGEPRISLDLLNRASIATPHIAGYSYEGKVRATRMAVDAICEELGLPHIEMAQKVAPGAASSVNAVAIANSYNPMTDDKMLRENPAEFERLRDNYALRSEVAGGKID